MQLTLQRGEAPHKSSRGHFHLSFRVPARAEHVSMSASLSLYPLRMSVANSLTGAVLAALHDQQANLEALGLHQDLKHPSCSYCNRQFHSQKALNRHRYGRPHCTPVHLFNCSCVHPHTPRLAPDVCTPTLGRARALPFPLSLLRSLCVPCSRSLTTL